MQTIHITIGDRVLLKEASPDEARIDRDGKEITLSDIFDQGAKNEWEVGR
jgi:hypothetical protein